MTTCHQVARLHVCLLLYKHDTSTTKLTAAKIIFLGGGLVGRCDLSWTILYFRLLGSFFTNAIGMGNSQITQMLYFVRCIYISSYLVYNIHSYYHRTVSYIVLY